MFDVTTEQFNQAIQYFQQNPNKTKYSRKISDLPCSFIKITKNAPDNSLIAISRQTLGAGSSGKVKLGRNLITGELTAIKIQIFCFKHKPAIAAINHFHHKEITILNQLNQLYGTIFRAKQHSNRYFFKHYIFSMYFEGITLREYFPKNTPFKFFDFIDIMLKTLEQLKLLHEKNIVHGDLSFRNILVHKKADGEITVRLIDFGLSNFLQDGITQFPIQDYSFNEQAYTPPECDPKISPKLLTYYENNINNSAKISAWAQKGYGFHNPSSDLYSLIWSAHYYCSYAQPKINPFILSLYHKVCNKFSLQDRPSLEELTEELTKQQRLRPQ